jgi:hypothetical protein
MIRKFNEAIRIMDPFFRWFATELAVCMICLPHIMYIRRKRTLPECIIPTLQGVSLHIYHGDINEMCSCWFFERDTDFHLLIKREESG